MKIDKIKSFVLKKLGDYILINSLLKFSKNRNTYSFKYIFEKELEHYATQFINYKNKGYRNKVCLRFIINCVQCPQCSSPLSIHDTAETISYSVVSVYYKYKCSKCNREFEVAMNDVDEKKILQKCKSKFNVSRG